MNAEHPQSTGQTSSNRGVTRAGPAFIGLAILAGAIAFFLWQSSPPQMVNSIVLNEKPAMTSSLGGLQLGERIAEGGVFDLYLKLEFFDGENDNEFKTDVIEVETLGNGVTFDVPDDLIEYRNLRRVTAMDEDLISDDIYDSIDVTLGEPYVGSVYQFHISRTQPRRIPLLILLAASGSLFLLGAILHLRRFAR